MKLPSELIELADEDFGATLAWCRLQPNPLDAFNDVVLMRPRYWDAQRRVCAALWDDSVTTVAVPAGHSVGKSYVAAGVIVGWLTLHPDSLVISTGPSNTQIEAVLWKEVRRAVRDSVLSGYGRLTAGPQKLDYGDGHHALGYSTNMAERLQGHHSRGPVLVVVDEASGVEDPEVWATLTSLKPRKRLLIGNPLRPDGPFYDVCLRSERDPSVRLIRVSSLDSPDIGDEHSDRGLADGSWLREMESEYGRDSMAWRVRVEANFPDDAHDVVIPRAWIDLAMEATHVRSGPCRIAIDLAEGNERDRSVVLCRDDNGIVACFCSRVWSLEKTAEVAAEMARTNGVPPHRITWDVAGIGADFANRLQRAGLHGCKPYRGGSGSSHKFTNLRTAAAWALRQRLDPNRMAVRHAEGKVTVQNTTPWEIARRQSVEGPVAVDKQNPRVQFSMPKEFVQAARDELQGLRYSLMAGDKVALESKEDFMKRIRKSPDLVDALTQSFAFPD